MSFVAAHTQARYQPVADASLHLQERLAAVEGLVASLPADDPPRKAEVIRTGLNIDAIRFQNVATA